MLWSGTCDLVEKRRVLDDEGVPHAADVRTEVFCNEFSVGARTWSSMYEMGVSPDAELQVWSDEYSGQRDVVYGGVWYSVETVRREGDFTRLVLRRQQSDSPDGEEGGDDQQDG